jgi:hypothetical protein
MDHYTLMTRALNKYKIMLDDSEWCTIMLQEEQIISVSAQCKQLKDSNLKISKAADSRSFHQVPFKDKTMVRRNLERVAKRVSMRMSWHGKKHHQRLEVMKQKA